jgi:hypothetical protein
LDFEGTTNVQWTQVSAEQDGWLRHPGLAGGYAWTQFEWPREEVVLLAAQGHAMAYVNGIPRAGDPYATGRYVLPVALRAGTNELLLHAAGDTLRAELVPVDRVARIELRDAVLPDLVRGESGPRFASVVVLNLQNQTLLGAQLTAVRAGGGTVTAAVGSLPALGSRHVVLPLEGVMTSEESQSQAVRVQIDLTIPEDGPRRQLVDSAAFDLAVVDAAALHTRTYLSGVDGSVQSYRLQAASGPAPHEPHGVLLQLHDAGLGQEPGFPPPAPLPWAHQVFPEGRRRLGCDWEDLSQRDAGEALVDCLRHVAADPARIWLAGLGSGGHGVWRLAVESPDRFAAIASLGGWIDYSTYGSSLPTWQHPNPVESLLERCAQANQLLPLLENLELCGVQLQHRAADPLVPLSEAHTLRSAMAAFHGDFAYRELYEEPATDFEQQVAGGAAARAFLRYRARVDAADVDHLRLATFDPGVVSRNRWLTILQQLRPRERSQVEAVRLAQQRQFAVRTQNVACLALEVDWLTPDEDVWATVDGQPIGPIGWPQTDAEAAITLKLRDGRWEAVDGLPAGDKSPRRSDGFRSLFDRQVVLVYGTGGNDQENAWAVAKARFDAEMFWTRIRGAAQVIADRAFDVSQSPDQNVVLYGNADSNSAWPKLLSTSPVQVRRGQIRIGMRPESGADLACLMVLPRKGSDRALVGAVAGTGVAGMRCTDRLPYFVNGVILPDLMILDAAAVEGGTSHVRAAGFFGNDWSLQSGEIAWRDAAL